MQKFQFPLGSDVSEALATRHEEAAEEPPVAPFRHWRDRRSPGFRRLEAGRPPVRSRRGLETRAERCLPG